MGCQRTRWEGKEGKGGDKKKGEREGKEREMREKRGRGGEERGKRKGDAPLTQIPGSASGWVTVFGRVNYLGM